MFTCLLLSLIPLGIVSAAFGWTYDPPFNWSFQNNCYFDFNQAIDFAAVPSQGVPYDNSLVGYWNMDEGVGTVIHDSSGNNNSGVVHGATFVDGKYGNALSFDGVGNYATTNSSNLTLQMFSASIWIKIEKSNTTQTIIDEGVNSNGQNGWLFRVTSNNKPNFILGANSTVGLNNLVGNTVLNMDTWYQLVAVTNKTQLLIYVNGVLDSSMNRTVTISYTNATLTLGNRPMLASFFNGFMDDVRIYNRSLSASEVAALYAQPNPNSLANYYNYQDPVTNNTLLIHIDSPDANNNSLTLVTCTDFFADNRLTFKANNSATLNLWSNLGQPVFTTGVWNSQNYTTTLTLDASSIAQLNWNSYKITTYVDAHSSVSPSNVTINYSGNQTLNFNASQGYRFNVTLDGVPQGSVSGYTFSNVTEPHMVNVTSTKVYEITAFSGDNGSITPSGSVIVDFGQAQQFDFTANSGYHVSILLVDNISQPVVETYTFSNVQKNHTISVSFAINTYNITALSDVHSTITPGNVSVNYGGSQNFDITTLSGYSISHVYVDNTDKGNITSYTFTDIQSDHKIAVSSTPIASSQVTSSSSSTIAPTSTPTSNPTVSPTASTPTPTTSTIPQATSTFPMQTTLIVAVAIAFVAAIFGLAFKKDYVTIEVVDESDNCY